MKLLPYIIVGITCGILFARYQFCFAAAVRNCMSFRRKGKALLVLSMIIFSAVLLNAAIGLGALRETVKALMPATFMGGILFGIGMIVAGGCTAGQLYRTGEGSLPALVSCVGMIVGMGAFGFIVASRFTKELPHFVSGTILKTLSIHPLIFAIVVALCAIPWVLLVVTETPETRKKAKTFLIGGVVVALCAAAVYEVIYLGSADCQDISPSALREKIAAGEEVVILDIQPAKFFQKNHLHNAVSLRSLHNGLQDFQEHKDKMVVVVCGKGVVSRLFGMKMSKSGFTKVYNLKGGMGAWQ